MYQNGFEEIDISGLTGLYGYINFANCYDMSILLFPTTSANFSEITAYSCKLNGTCDLRGFTGRIDNISFDANKYEYVLLPDSSYPYKIFSFQSNQLKTLDVSNRMFNGAIYIGVNYDLSILTLPDASCNFTQFYAPYTKLHGVYDVSQHWFSGNFDITQTDISSITWDIDKCLGLTSLQIGYTKWDKFLDVSCLSNLTYLSVAGDTYLPGMIFPKDASNLELRLDYTTFLHGTLDLSSMKSISSLTFSGTDVSTIIWPYQNAGILLWAFEARNTQLSGTLDVSEYLCLNGSFEIAGNPRLTKLILPDVSMRGWGGQFDVGSCDFTELDLSKVVKAQYSFNGEGNYRLQNVIWPEVFENQLWYCNWSECSLNQTTVDGLLPKLVDLYTTAGTAWWDLNISLEGGGNAPLTDGSTNADLLALQSLFTGFGRTLTVTYNT